MQKFLVSICFKPHFRKVDFSGTFRERIPLPHARWHSPVNTCNFSLQQQHRQLFDQKREKPVIREKPLPLQFKEAAYNKDYGTAMRLLEEIKKSGMTLDISVYSPLIHLLHSLKDYEGVIKTWEELKNANVPADSISYARTIDSYIHLKRKKEALNLWKDMESHGYSLAKLAFFLIPTLEDWEQEEKRKKNTTNE
jgi:hypothetical protein